MPRGLLNIEWSNLCAMRRYPLADDASGADQTESFTLPQDFLVGLDLPVNAGVDVDPTKFYVKHVGVYASGYSVVVGYDGEDGPVDVATALVPRVGHVTNRTYNLGGIEPFDDTLGKVSVGGLANVDAQPPGFYTFDPAAGRLDPDCVRPYIRGVSGIVVVNGNEESEVLQGVVRIRAGENCQLVPILVTGEDPEIQVNFVAGQGTIEECVCAGDAQVADCIRTINGIPGTTAERDFTFVAGTCVVIGAIENGLAFADSCGKACAGCPELEVVTQALKDLQIQAATVQQFADRLLTSAQVMEMTVLGSRVNDDSCAAC